MISKLSEWHISTGKDGHKRIFDDTGKPIFILNQSQTMRYHGKYEHITIMNLIATAPELMNALSALVDAHDEEPSMLTEKEWQDARKAIAKAQQRLDI